MPTLTLTDSQKRILLLDYFHTEPVQSDQIPEELLHYGRDAGLIQLVDNPGGDAPTVCRTGTAVESALALHREGHPLMNLDISPHGLRIQQDLTSQQWTFTVKRLRLVKEIYHTALGDLISYGRSRFGDEFVNDNLEQLEFPFEDVAHAQSIAKVPLALRENVSLTTEHYYILGLNFPEDATSQQMWADRAKEHKLSPIALKRSIERGDILTDKALKESTGHGSGIPVLNGISLHFTRWKNQVGGEKTILGWSPPLKQQFLEEIGPIVELALEVRETLEGGNEE